MTARWNSYLAIGVTLVLAGIVAVEAFGQLRSQVGNNTSAIQDNGTVIEIVRDRADDERRAIGELNTTSRAIQRRLDRQFARIEAIYRLLIEARLDSEDSNVDLRSHRTP